MDTVREGMEFRCVPRDHSRLPATTVSFPTLAGGLRGAGRLFPSGGPLVFFRNLRASHSCGASSLWSQRRRSCRCRREGACTRGRTPNRLLTGRGCAPAARRTIAIRYDRAIGRRRGSRAGAVRGSAAPDSRALPALCRLGPDCPALGHVRRHAYPLKFSDRRVPLLPGHRGECSHLAGMGGRAGEIAYGDARCACEYAAFGTGRHA